MTRDFWTAERTSILNAKRTEGWTGSDIAKLLGCSRCAALGKIHRLKLPLRAVGTPVNKPVRIRPAPAVKVPTPVPPPINTVTSDEHNSTHCKWPYGDPLSDNFAYCGTTRQDNNKPYCAYHNSVAYVPPPKRERNR